MNNEPKKVNTAIIVILYLLAAVFLVYGIYMTYDAVTYVQTYDTEAAVSTANMVQYVAEQSAVYYGFAIVIFAAAFLLGALNKVQTNLYRSLMFPSVEEGLVEEPLIDDGEQIALDLNENDAQPDETAEPEIISTAEEIPVESEPVPSAVQADEDDLTSEELETEKTEIEEPETASEPQAVSEQEPVAVPAFPTESEVPTEHEPPSAAISSPEHETSQIAESADVRNERPHPEPEIVQAPLAEEFTAQFVSKPADSIPVNTTESDATQTPKAIEPSTPEPQASPEKDAAQIPDAVLQTRRKRGLKYETVAIEDPEPAVQGFTSDTIRLKKEDTEAISRSFIKGIFEKDQQ